MPVLKLSKEAREFFPELEQEEYEITATLTDLFHERIGEGATDKHVKFDGVNNKGAFYSFVKDDQTKPLPLGFIAYDRK